MTDVSSSLSMATSALNNRAAPAPLKTADVSEAREAAQDFEAYFISQFLGTMFQGIKTDGPFGGGQAENMYRGLMMQEYGKVVAAQGGFGIADVVERELLIMQEAK
jgi:peptidoglycan hydrolase FlgJ